ncbi:MAG: GtrA family protein [Verrucomicrobiota bacterium]
MSRKDHTTSQFVRFLIVSAVAISIDAIVYTMAVNDLGISEAHSKRYSFALASIWGFIANKYFTFRQTEVKIGEPIKFALLYFTSWLVNGYTHDLIHHFWNSKLVAFLNASAVAAIWNFSGQKFFVFTNQRTRARTEAAEVASNYRT